MFNSNARKCLFFAKAKQQAFAKEPYQLFDFTNPHVSKLQIEVALLFYNRLTEKQKKDLVIAAERFLHELSEAARQHLLLLRAEMILSTALPVSIKHRRWV